MELAQAKIPYLPPDWTLARAAKYAAKLGVFILVPGLHQIACKRRVLGGLLLVLYFGTEFVQSNRPVEGLVDPFHIYFVTYNVPELFLNFSWFLLAFDLRNLETRKFKVNLLLVLSFAILIYFDQTYRPSFLYIYVEREGYTCPAFCTYDVVEFEPYALLYDLEIVAEGDFVVLGDTFGPYYTSKLLSGPLKNYLPGTVKEMCAGYGDSDELQRLKKRVCEVELEDKRIDFLAPGGPNPDFKSKDGIDVSMISLRDVHGVRPKKIGNTHEYFVISDEVTDVVGNALLTIYKWTGANLFGLSERNSPD